MATKKTLKIKEFFLPDFWKETALKSPQFRFQKINQVSFVAIFSFSLITIIILIIIIVFRILLLFNFIFNLLFFYFGLLSIIIVLFFKFIFFFIYFLFAFEVHFCSIFLHIFPFLPFFFFLCFNWIHHVNIFSFIPTDLLKILREERQDHSN